MKRFILSVFVCLSVNAGASDDVWDANIADRHFDRATFTRLPGCADPSLAGEALPRNALCAALDVGHVTKVFLESDGQEARYLVYKFYRVVHARFALVAYVAVESVVDAAKPVTFKKVTEEDQQDDLPTLVQIVRVDASHFKVNQISLKATAAGKVIKNDYGQAFAFELP